LKEREEEEAPFVPPALVLSRQNRQRLLKWLALIIGLTAIFYAGQFAWQKLRPRKFSAAPFLTQTVNDLTINFIASAGQLRAGSNEVVIEFRGAQGQLVDVGNVRFEMDMSMPGMQMHSGGAIEKTNIPGRYRAKIKIDMSGDWNAKISYDGPHRQGQQSFSVTVK
jgi:hypothetical protein